MSNRNTIVVHGDGVQFEALANAAITPGQLVEEMSTGKIRKHATAGAAAQKAFALEDFLQGKTIAQDISANNVCLYRCFRLGDEVYAILADGENVAVGDKLESAGGGELRKQVLTSSGAVANPAGLIGFAREAVDASDSKATPVDSRRLIVRIA